MVLYLPSTTGEFPPIAKCQGEQVYMPLITNTGTPWKNTPPDWLSTWVAKVQVDAPRCRWSLVGFSRGAAWALILAANERLNFHRVLVVAPYAFPSCTHHERENIIAAFGRRRPGTFCVAFGSKDQWQPDKMMNMIKKGLQTHLWRILEDANHETSLERAMDELWDGVNYCDALCSICFKPSGPHCNTCGILE